VPRRDDYGGIAFQGVPDAIGLLRSFSSRSPGQGGSGNVCRPMAGGVALERYCQWAVAPGYSVFRLPALRFISRGNRGRAVFPNSSSSDRNLGCLQLVEGASWRSSYPVAFPNDGIFGSTKLLPIAPDMLVLWTAVTYWLRAPPQRLVDEVGAINVGRLATRSFWAG
jgi:hypothetical protein